MQEKSIEAATQHDFMALHTWVNKLTGILIFTVPFLYCLCWLRFTGIILCDAAVVSACEELVITVKSKELIYDCKGILCGKFEIYKEKEVVQR